MTPLVSLLALADTDFGHMDNWSAGTWILMVIGMVIVWGLLILGIVWVVREVSGRGGQAPVEASPLDVLDRRLAAGEITPDDYEERRRILQGQSPTGSA